jgi:uncharacterized membrane protein YhaH (DUF805 family)
MTAANPYAPPQAIVADVHESADTVQPVRLWTTDGRIGRLRYIAHNTAAYVVVVVVAALLGGALGAAGLGVISAIVFGLAGIGYFVFMVIKTVQRSHDMGWSGWTALLALIPLVGLIWLLNPGTRGNNRYGAPPPPNGLGVWLIAVVIPLLLVIAMIAVAIPAYNDYSQRARAAQQK